MSRKFQQLPLKAPPRWRQSDRVKVTEPEPNEINPEQLQALYEGQEGDDDTPIKVTFELQRDLDKRLDRYLVDRIPFLSRTSLQRLIHEQSITVNGRIPKPSTKLHKGDTIIAVLPPPPSSEVPPDDIPLDIVHEDSDIIVVNKQAGLLVHPARSYKRGTLINALAWHFLHRSQGALSEVGKEFARPGVVHRLDRWTTGVMVAAKTDTAHWRIAKQFENRTTEKRYLALVHGTPVDGGPNFVEYFVESTGETFKNGPAHMPSKDIAKRGRRKKPAADTGPEISMDDLNDDIPF